MLDICELYGNTKIVNGVMSSIGFRRNIMAIKKQTNEQTSSKVATKASQILRDPKSTAAQKSVAASALTQARNKK